MPARGIRRGATIVGYATTTNVPIYVDSDDNILKYVPAGSGTTEVEVLDASATQTLTNKTLTSPTITTPTINGITSLSSTIATSVATFTSNPTFNGTVAFTSNPSFSGNPTFTGSPSFTGIPTFSSGYVDNVENLSTAGAVSAYGLSNVAIASSSNGTTAYTGMVPVAGVRKTVTCSTASTGGVSTVTIDSGTLDGTSTIATFSSQGFLGLFGLSTARWMITSISTATVTLS